MPTFTRARQCTDLHELLKVACCCSAGCVCDRNIVFGTEPSLEACRAFLEDARDYLFLPLVQLATKTIIELCFLNEEIDALKCRPLSIQDRFRKENDLVGDIKRALVPLKLGVVGLPALLDCEGE